MIFNKILFLVFIYICSYNDAKSKKIYLLPCILFGITGICINVIFGKIEWISILCSFSISFFLYVVRKATHNGIGMGDIWISVVTGIYFGFDGNSCVFLYALIVAGIYALILIVCRQASRKRTIPLAPCIMAGYIFFLCS
ncbi:MAG: prepilin peptidase [Eubacterium sp.]